MGQIVAMETGITSTVSLRIFWHLTWSFICDLYICVPILSKFGQELAILEKNTLTYKISTSSAWKGH
jgi:hypothetical protein